MEPFHICTRRWLVRNSLFTHLRNHSHFIWSAPKQNTDKTGCSLKASTSREWMSHRCHHRSGVERLNIGLSVQRLLVRWGRWGPWRGIAPHPHAISMVQYSPSPLSKQLTLPRNFSNFPKNSGLLDSICFTPFRDYSSQCFRMRKRLSAVPSTNRLRPNFIWLRSLQSKRKHKSDPYNFLELKLF